jgi:rubrerythrin
MGPIEALELAISKEIEAVKMYQKYAVDYPAIKETFWFLADEEQKHKQLLEQKKVELTKSY